MLIQTAGLTELGFWSITFVVGGIGSVVAWLVLRHYQFAMPAYRRIFGHDRDDTAAGFLKDTQDRFDAIEQSQADLRADVTNIHADIRNIDRRQELVLSNQATIAKELGVNLERPRFHRERRENADDQSDDDAGD